VRKFFEIPHRTQWFFCLVDAVATAAADATDAAVDVDTVAVVVRQKGERRG
jgi:hypothetical protein